MQFNVKEEPYNAGLEEAKLAQQNSLRIVELDRERQLRSKMPHQANSLVSEVARDSGMAKAEVVPLRAENADIAIRRGIIDAFVKTCQRWQLSHEEQCRLLGYQPSDVIGQLMLAGSIVPSSQDIRDRVGLVVGISLSLGALFDNVVKAEITWLNAQRDELNGKSALEHLLEGRIANLFFVEQLLRQERGL